MTRKALITGATGRFGRHMTQALADAGWEVRAYNRTQDLTQAATGMDIIVNGMNPPNYQNWDTEIPRITRETIAAAKASGATVLLPGNVYNLGRAPAPWTSQTAHNPCSRKGKIRAEMEAQYRASGVKTILLRAGDFIDTEASGGFFDMIIAPKPGKSKITYPGRTDCAHAWTYLPDFARALAELANIRDSLPDYVDLPFPGYTLTGDALCVEIERAAGRPITIKQMAWWPLKLASPFWRLGRELLEMRYLWNHPHSLDGAEFHARLPDFKATDLQTALKSALPR